LRTVCGNPRCAGLPYRCPAPGRAARAAAWRGAPLPSAGPPLAGAFNKLLLTKVLLVINVREFFALNSFRAIHDFLYLLVDLAQKLKVAFMNSSVNTRRFNCSFLMTSSALCFLSAFMILLSLSTQRKA
jgi:predicted ferric reductase